jgi:hypothetical protein
MARQGKRFAWKNTKTFHNWTKLPHQLKLMVLAHYLPESTVFQHTIFKRFLCNLLATRNREFVSLALDTCFKCCTFSIDIGVTSLPGLVVPSPQLASKIRHLEINARECLEFNTIDHMLVNPYSFCRWLLRPKLRLDESAWGPYYVALRERLDIPMGDWETEWQKRFTSLKSLDLVINVYSRRLSGDPELDKVYMRLVEDTEMFLQADEVYATFSNWHDLKHATWTRKNQLNLYKFMTSLEAWIEGSMTRKK